jgi:uncharacterized membrane protein
MKSTQMQENAVIPSSSLDDRVGAGAPRPAKREEKRVLALDGLRGLAILGVFCFHFGG